MKFNSGSVHNLVGTQNKFIKDELVTKLGIVESSRLGAVLSVDRNLKQRAVACHDAVLDHVVAARVETITEKVRRCVCGWVGG